MTLHLRPMTQEEIRAFIERSKERYVTELVEDMMLDRDEAERKAGRDAGGIASGVVPEGHALFVVEDEAGERVGEMWFGPSTGDFPELAFLYDVFIEERRRGRGLGKEIMRLFEQEAARRGCTRVGLNVFGSNEIARRLYRSCGYAETNVWMGKRLDTPVD